MKALTISQPYASHIAGGEKFVENRTWPTSYRGLVAVHAGKGTQYLTKETLAKYPTGCIVALARIVDCVHLDRLHSMSETSRIGGRTVKEITRHKHTEGPFCWILERVIKLDSPVECRGAQGLWDVPAETTALIADAIPDED